MTASLPSLMSAIEKSVVIIALLTLTPVLQPELVKAADSLQTGESKALVFEINPNQKEATLKTETDSSLTYSTVLAQDGVKKDIIAKKLQAYLEKYNSPLAPYAREIVDLPQWQRAVALTYQESHFCRTARDNNCGSIGVKPGHRLWRKYATPFDGLKDLALLLEKPIYKERYTTCQKMIGVYVVPGSRAWLHSCDMHSKALLSMTAEAEQEQFALLNAANTVSIATADISLAQ